MTTVKIDLNKRVQTAKVSLEKRNIENVKAQVVLLVDISYSMINNFNYGIVQDVIERFLAVGMNIDLDKSIDVFAFNTGVKEISPANEGNYKNFVNDVFLKKTSVNGGTNYAPAMQAIVNKYGTTKKSGLGGLFGKKTTPTEPTFVFFLTDGNNFDKSEAEKVIRDASGMPIFWQFIGIGHEQFDFLQKLDDLSGRKVDNADFYKVTDIANTPDNVLYDNILNEFPSWLQEVKQKGILA
jgi:hypothetical protein